MFELNVEMKKHCRTVEKWKWDVDVFFFLKRGFEYTCTLTLHLFIQMPRMVNERYREYGVLLKLGTENGTESGTERKTENIISSLSL